MLAAAIIVIALIIVAVVIGLALREER